MLLPSLHRSEGSADAWNVARAGLYGAGIGALAALVKTLAPFRANAGSVDFAARLAELALATLAFALLCAGAAALRNVIARHLVWHGDH